MVRFYRALFAALCLVAALTVAARSYRTVYICTKDGKKSAVAISQDLHFRFPDSQTLELGYVTGDAGSEPTYTECVSVSYDNLEALRLSADDPSGVDAVFTVYPMIKEGVLRIDNVSEPLSLSVCKVDGTVLMSRSVSAPLALDLNEYGSGILLVNVNGITYKFLMK